MRPKRILIAIIGLVLLTRLSGIFYGLPLWIIGDEPSNILGALKMIEVKSFIPALHQDAFKTLLYYPPYLSYLYLPAFLMVGGTEAAFYYFQNGSLEHFSDYLSLDLSNFFIVARLFQLGIAIISILLIAKAAEQYSGKARAGLIAAFLVAASPLHIALTVGARPWLAASLTTAFALWILTKQNLPYAKKIFLVVLGCGVGVGVNTIGGIPILLIPLWHFLEEKRGIREFIKLWPYGFVFALLLIIPRLLNAVSYGFTVDVTLEATKSLAGLAVSPFVFFKNFAVSEPILFFTSLFGAIYGTIKRNSLSWITLISIVFYPTIFYLLFRPESRFILLLMPLLAVQSGVFLDKLIGRLEHRFTYGNLALYVILLAAIIPTVGFTRTLHQNDSRVDMLEYIIVNLPKNARIAYEVDLLRINPTVEAALDQKALDPKSLRRADISLLAIGKTNNWAYYSLNLGTLSKTLSTEELTQYLKKKKFTHLLIDERVLSLVDQLTEFSFKKIHSHEEREAFSLTHSEPKGNFWAIAKGTMSGPKLYLYEISPRATPDTSPKSAR
jgi:hypothetical protein